MRHELQAVLAIAQRDLTKFARDRTRLLSSLVFPFIFIGLIGGTFAPFGSRLGVGITAYVFTGVLIQTMFQSSAQGILSLLDDRLNDFSQEMFIAPISRYSIVVGKIAGESLVALVQGAGIIAFGILLGVRPGVLPFLLLVPVAAAACLVGGAFGLLLLTFVNSRRAADLIFPFVFLPQFFLAGAFTPIKGLPPTLETLSRLAPMRYPIDLGRNLFYAGSPEFNKVVLDPSLLDLTVMAAMFAVFVTVGTSLFVRQERNR